MHWDQVIRVDLTAAWRAVRLAWPLLRAAAGSVVLIGSIVGSAEGSSRSPAYAAAKAGLEGLGRSMALVGAREGIRVNVLAPGAFDTPFDEQLFPPAARPDVPLGRMGTPDEAAAGHRVPAVRRGLVRERRGVASGRRQKRAVAGILGRSGGA